MPRDSGRPCGCDPKINHVCDSHDGARDVTSTVFIGHDDAERALVGSANLTVTGPTSKGCIGLSLDGSWIWFDRFVVEDMLYELQTRLAKRV